MPRNISFALTTRQFRARQKDVTRRNGWLWVEPGDVLNAVEKCQGLKKGERVKSLGLIRVVGVRRERLDEISNRPGYGAAECIREGFPDLTPAQFVAMYCKANPCTGGETIITRIEYDYVDGGDGK